MTTPSKAALDEIRELMKKRVPTDLEWVNNPKAPAPSNPSKPRVSNELEDKLNNMMAAHFGVGGVAKKGLGLLAEAFKPAEEAATKVLTAADRARVGKLAAAKTAEQPVTKMSEAIGNQNIEGKKLRVTQTDRTAAKHLGGAPFSMMQQVDPAYADVNATWGVKTPGAAKNITNQADADVVWSTLIGSPTQHRSNEIVFDKLYKAFQKSAKEGNLSAELREKFNRALEPLFGEGADIRDPKLRKEIDTFEKRAWVGNLLLGEGIGGATRGGSIIPGAKIMAETTEPMLKDVPTFSIGPRLFELNKEIHSRPDLHPAFPEILGGKDLGELFMPAPNRIALPDFNKEFTKRTGRKAPGYYDLTMTPEGQPYPTQDITEEYLTHLQKEGYAEGGAIHMAEGGAPKYVDPSQLFPINPDIKAPAVARTRAGTPASDASMLEPLEALWNTGAGALRGATATALGAPADILNLLKNKRSGSADIPYGSEYFKENLPSAGKSQEAGVAEELGGFVPLPAQTLTVPAKAIAKGAKAAAPYAGKLAQEFAEATQFGLPLQMSVMPEDKAAYSAMMREKYAAKNAPKQVAEKAPEVKAPADDLGFYAPAEKAALNIQRKSGSGEAFLSDLKKFPDVTSDELAWTGIQDALKGRTGVTREEVQSLVKESKIPLEEEVRRNWANENPEDLRYDAKQLRRKANEAEDSAYDELIAEAKELEDKANKIETTEAQFGPESHPSYNMPGGENYREIRIKLPSNEKQMSYEDWVKGGRMGDWHSNSTIGSEKDFYNKSHSEQPNVLLHLRVADHTDAQGKSGLLIDELQSDWHQAGRDKGYKVEQKPRDLKVMPVETGGYGVFDKNKNAFISAHLDEPSANKYMQRVLQERPTSSTGVPDAPFKDSWYQLGLKRAIKEAADNGMDRIYLTTGKTQNARYDLSKQVEGIRANLNPDGTYQLGIRPHGKQMQFYKDNIPADELAEHVGKDVAKKITGEVKEAGVGSGKEFSGLDLQVGGKGMKKHYDETYLNYLKKYAKEHGTTVGETTLPVQTTKFTDLSSDELAKLQQDPEFMKHFLDYSKGRPIEDIPSDAVISGFNYALKKTKGEKVYYMDINPKVKNSTAKGQAYAKGGAVSKQDDLESRLNSMLSKHFAKGGEAGGQGLAPYGVRHSGEGAKGKGYFGELPHKSGSPATEISAAHPDIGEYPLIVPTLTREELDHLLSGNPPTEDIYLKAENHAKQRIGKGKHPFAQPDELRYPVPNKMAEGGAAYNTNLDKFNGSFIKIGKQNG